jgi:hypothetical protein
MPTVLALLREENNVLINSKEYFQVLERTAVDDMLRHEHDNPSIGILLCKERDKLTAEYALRDINKPIGVSEYRLSDFVPQELADTLPSVEDIEKRIKGKYDIDEWRTPQ